MTNSNSEFDKVILQKALPVIIRTLLADGRLDKDKLDNSEYVRDVLANNQNIFDELSVVIVLHDQFVTSAKEAISANKYEVVVVLIATAIEQIVNTFYREVLTEKNNLSPDEITEVIRTTNFQAKLSWLLVLVADFDINDLDDELPKDIFRLMELRNQIVHYKAVPTSMSEKHPISKRIQEYGFDKMLTLPNELSELLNEIVLHNVRIEKPEYLTVLRTCESLLPP